MQENPNGDGCGGEREVNKKKEHWIFQAEAAEGGITGAPCSSQHIIFR
jgi:hypothetical protein